MSSDTMPEQKAIEMFLTEHPPSSGNHIFSGFVLALRETRQMTCRDISSGAKLPNSHGNHGSWLGAIGYFALLDQLGECFKPKGNVLKIGNSIQKALGHFTSLSALEINALYALRCAFTHDYSLYNINKNKPHLTHNFIVGQGATKTVVTLPKKNWDGDLKNHGSDIKTVVSLEAFGDLVEDIIVEIRRLSRDENLEILLTDGSDELVRRYMFIS